MAGLQTDDIDARVAARLSARRTELAMHPRALDALIGASQGTVEGIEAGRRRATAALLFRLSHSLGVDVGFFFAEQVSPDAGNCEAAVFVDGDRWEEAHRFFREFARVGNPHARRRLMELIADLAERAPESGSRDAAAEPAAAARVAVGA